MKSVKFPLILALALNLGFAACQTQAGSNPTEATKPDGKIARQINGIHTTSARNMSGIAFSATDYLRWQNPDRIDFASITIRVGDSDFPQDLTEGTLLLDEGTAISGSLLNASSFEAPKTFGPTATHYYTIFTHDSSGGHLLSGHIELQYDGSPDSDGDGIPDSAEAAFEYDVLGNQSNASAIDTDGDTIDDYTELINGTNPNNDDTDPPVILSFLNPDSAANRSDFVDFGFAKNWPNEDLQHIVTLTPHQPQSWYDSWTNESYAPYILPKTPGTYTLHGWAKDHGGNIVYAGSFDTEVVAPIRMKWEGSYATAPEEYIQSIQVPYSSLALAIVKPAEGIPHLIVTTDGGSSWTKRTIPLEEESGYFYDTGQTPKFTCAIVGGVVCHITARYSRTLSTTSYKTIIHRTTDLGQTWDTGEQEKITLYGAYEVDIDLNKLGGLYVNYKAGYSNYAAWKVFDSGTNDVLETGSLQLSQCCSIYADPNVQTKAFIETFGNLYARRFGQPRFETILDLGEGNTSKIFMNLQGNSSAPIVTADGQLFDINPLLQVSPKANDLANVDPIRASQFSTGGKGFLIDKHSVYLSNDNGTTWEQRLTGYDRKILKKLTMHPGGYAGYTTTRNKYSVKNDTLYRYRFTAESPWVQHLDKRYHDYRDEIIPTSLTHSGLALYQAGVNTLTGDVIIQRSYDTGWNFHTVRTIPAESFSTKPQLVTDSRGHVYVAYQDKSGLQDDLVIEKTSNNGYHWQVVDSYSNSDPNNKATPVRLLIDDTDNMYLVGNLTRDTDNSHGMFIRHAAGGQAWSMRYMSDQRSEQATFAYDAALAGDDKIAVSIRRHKYNSGGHFKSWARVRAIDRNTGEDLGEKLNKLNTNTNGNKVVRRFTKMVALPDGRVAVAGHYKTNTTAYLDIYISDTNLENWVELENAGEYEIGHGTKPMAMALYPDGSIFLSTTYDRDIPKAVSHFRIYDNNGNYVLDVTGQLELQDQMTVAVCNYQEFLYGVTKFPHETDDATHLRTIIYR